MPVQHPRKYTNAKWHVSLALPTGEGSLRRAAKTLVPMVMDDLEQRLGPERKLLVICHQDVEPHFLAYKPDGEKKAVNFAAFDVAHYGAIDGRNAWQDFDALLTFGLPYMPQEWAPNMFRAIVSSATKDGTHSSPIRRSTPRRSPRS